jgi:hypothetical protein
MAAVLDIPSSRGAAGEAGTVERTTRLVGTDAAQSTVVKRVGKVGDRRTQNAGSMPEQHGWR